MGSDLRGEREVHLGEWIFEGPLDMRACVAHPVKFITISHPLEDDLWNNILRLKVAAFVFNLDMARNRQRPQKYRGTNEEGAEFLREWQQFLGRG